MTLFVAIPLSFNVSFIVGNNGIKLNVERLNVNNITHI